MKALLLIAAAALSLSACAGLEKWTGLTPEDQQCIAAAAVEAAQQDTTMGEKIAAVELVCDVSRTTLIETAIKAAMAGLDK